MNRRDFLSSISCSLVGLSEVSLVRPFGGSGDGACWLDVCAPFISYDSAAGMFSEIVLTSDNFSGISGYRDGKEQTEYEFHLYDVDGKPVNGSPRKLTVPAMRTTVIDMRELTGGGERFEGGLRIRLRPVSRDLTHASDLFSSAFVRWRNDSSWDNVHANPDPLGWQNTSSYFYSMPFPGLGEYDCRFGFFNPSEHRSAGKIVLYTSAGKIAASEGFDLKPGASLVFDLNTGKVEKSGAPPARKGYDSHGLLAVTNDEGTSKGFGYLMIHRRGSDRFSVEHPIHQGIFVPAPVTAPFDAGDRFRARNVLYSPLVFRKKKIGGVTLETRFYFGTGLPLEEAQWLYPFIVDESGTAVWSSQSDRHFAAEYPEQSDKGVIRLRTGQSFRLDLQRLDLPDNFSGGLGLAVSPDTTHTLQKVEVRVAEWGAHAFTHFRPGLRSARMYQKPSQRGGLATDYIVSGARLVRTKSGILSDEVIGAINIEDKGTEARPVLELFGSKGLFKRIQLPVIPGFACRHFLLSDLVPGEVETDILTIRMVDEQATLLMSAVHLDYRKRDIALDHGSDRFSTYLDYGCR